MLLNERIITLSLFLSLFINILFFLLGSIFVAKRGVLLYISRKISLLWNSKFRVNTMYDSPFYQDKKTHFETLPKSEEEIIFLGDSLTDLCEWSEFFRNSRIKNRGICGDTTEGILNRIDNIVESKPQKLFLMIGINDLSQGRKVEDVLNSYKLILKTLQEQTPKTKVFIQSLLPVNTQSFPNRNPELTEKVIQVNATLKELAKEFSFQYIDLYSSFLDSNNQLDAHYTSDGVHLKGQGYLIWQGIIEKDVVN
jgi:lysophospholipase L1-like esterase